MSRHPRAEIRQDIVAEAAAWFVELSEDPQDRSTRESFDQWLRRSPEHVHAFLQVTAHWEESLAHPTAVESVESLLGLAQADTKVIQLTSQAAPSAGLGSDNATEGQLVSEANGVHTGPRALGTRDYLRLAGRWQYILAASLMLAVGALVWNYFLAGVYTTGVGEQYALTLLDGSTVELNALSRVRIRYSSKERRIELLEGQALFRVAHDKSRPFVVESPDATVRAVGTQFDIYRRHTGTTITVVEGTVAVGNSPDERTAYRERLAAEGPANEVYLGAGQQLTVAHSPHGELHPHHTDVHAATAWTEHRLVFKDAPLSEVVAEFNRHSRRPLRITDPTIKATRISGSFSSSDPATLLQFLSEVGSYSVRETPSAIEISPK